MMPFPPYPPSVPIARFLDLWAFFQHCQLRGKMSHELFSETIAPENATKFLGITISSSVAA